MGMVLMLTGAMAVMNIIASLFFLKFFKTTKDRFFFFFAWAFIMEGICRLALGLHAASDENEPLIYLLRLFSYLLILYAILDKNMKSRNM